MYRMFIICLLFAFQLNAQNANPLAFFDELEVRGNINLSLIQGEDPSISIEAGEKHRVEYTVQGDKLLIKHEQMLGPKGWEGCAVKIQLVYNDLRSLKAIAGAEVTTQGKIAGPSCAFHFASGANGKLEVDLARSEVTVKQGAVLEFQGAVEKIAGKVLTGGELEALEVDCKRAKMQVTTGGEACLFASESLEAMARTGGCLIYTGNPEDVAADYGMWGTVMSK